MRAARALIVKDLRESCGFTLVEVLMTLVILSLVSASLFSVTLSMQRDYARQKSETQAQEALRTAESALSTVLRTAGADLRGGTLGLLEADPLNHGVFDNVRAVADFNPADGDVSDPLEDVTVSVDDDTLFVRWQAGGATLPLAYPVRELLFEFYAGNGTALTTKAQAANAARVKIELAAAEEASSSDLERREAWVYLRNRR